MISREEKNKGVVKEIQKERTIAISKKIFKFISTIFILLFLCLLYVYFIGVKGLITKEYVIKNSQIPDSFHGVKILHFSDLLYGSTIDEDYLINLQQEIQKINPDIIFFTGNIISPNIPKDENVIKVLNTFLKEIPSKTGKYAIKGDKDNATFNTLFDNTGFSILNNEIINIYNNSKESINIVGLTKKTNETLTINNDYYTISLINNYDNYNEFNLKSNLVLSGYTLGGEIKLIDFPLLNKTKYSKDYFIDNDAEVFISNGLGSIHHMRLFNHPSINVYRLYNK